MNSAKQRRRSPSPLSSHAVVADLISQFALSPRRRHPASKRAAPAHAEKLALREHWTLQSSAKVEAKGEIISTPAFVPKGWHDATVPTTVVAALVKDKTLPDPFFATNLRQFPGVTYPIGGNFSNIAMQTDSPYAVSWWYRKQFAAPATYAGKTVWLNFKGINYRANVWLNGKQIANSDDIAGAWRTYEFNVTDAREARRRKRPGRAGLRPHRKRSGHHLRRLEPRASRQEHGPVARSLPHHQRAGRAALSDRRLQAEPARQRFRATHRHRSTEERHQPSGQRQTERPDRKASPSSRKSNSPPTKPKTSPSLPISSRSSSSPIRACGGRRRWASRISTR